MLIEQSSEFLTQTLPVDRNYWRIMANYLENRKNRRLFNPDYMLFKTLKPIVPRCLGIQTTTNALPSLQFFFFVAPCSCFKIADSLKPSPLCCPSWGMFCNVFHRIMTLMFSVSMLFCIAKLKECRAQRQYRTRSCQLSVAWPIGLVTQLHSVVVELKSRSSSAS